jgi:hypothetical protein
MIWWPASARCWARARRRAWPERAEKKRKQVLGVGPERPAGPGDQRSDDLGAGIRLKQRMTRAYRLPDDTLEEELTLLWKREMITGCYLPTWCKLEYWALVPSGPLARAISGAMTWALVSGSNSG